MIQDKLKWAQRKVRSWIVIYGKKGFRFYILNSLETKKKLKWKSVCLKGRGKVWDISRQIMLRSWPYI